MLQKSLTLGNTGILTTTERTIAVRFSQLLITQKAQTAHFSKSIVSLADIFYRNSGNMADLLNDLRSDLEKYFSQYFDQVDILATDSSIDEGINVREVDIQLRVVDDDGRVVDVGYVLSHSDEVLRLFKLSNTGERTYVA